MFVPPVYLNLRGDHHDFWTISNIFLRWYRLRRLVLLVGYKDRSFQLFLGESNVSMLEPADHTFA